MKSNLENKKTMAEFFEIENITTSKMDIIKDKTVHFGQAGASDYTITGNNEQKKRYINRHQKNENWDDPMTPGTLALNILWNKPTIKNPNF